MGLELEKLMFLLKGLRGVKDSYLGVAHICSTLIQRLVHPWPT